MWPTLGQFFKKKSHIFTSLFERLFPKQELPAIISPVFSLFIPTTRTGSLKRDHR